MNIPQDQLRKAAVLVAALDADTADILLERMSPMQAGLLRRMLVEIDQVDDGEQHAILAEFVGRPSRVLHEVDDSGVTLETAAGRAPPSTDLPFRFLHEAQGEDLSDLLAGEHPQTMAVVLSHLPAEQAAAAVASLTEGLQADVMRRLAKLDETDAVALREVESELERRFRRRFRDDQGRAAGVGAVRNILSEASPAIRRTLLANIARQDPQLAARLDGGAGARREAVVAPPALKFADLPRLSDATLRTLCDETDPEILAVALAGDLPLARRLTTALPRGRAEQLQAAVDTLGPTRLSDVELAQEELVRTACDLEAAGRLQWLVSV